MHEDTLARVALFKDLPRRDLQALAASARERKYGAGETLIRQGDTGAGLFILVDGKVRVFQQAEGGERDLGVYGAGDVLGEMALLDDQPRTASIVAMEPTTALLIPIWDFRVTLKENPEISIQLLAVLSQRLRRQELHGTEF